MDVFPVTVTMTDGTVLSTCRIITGPEGATVWRWDREQGDAIPVLISDTQPEQDGPRSWTIGEARIERQNGCGCSNPLKRWRPTGGAHRVQAG